MQLIGTLQNFLDGFNKMNFISVNWFQVFLNAQFSHYGHVYRFLFQVIHSVACSNDLLFRAVGFLFVIFFSIVFSCFFFNSRSSFN